MKRSPPQFNRCEPDYFSQQVAAARRFYRDMTFRRAEGFSVVAGGRETCAPGYEIHRKTFPYHSMEFVVGGRGALELNGQPYQLGPGTLFTYGPGIPHAITSVRQEPLVKYFVNVAGEEAQRLLEDRLLLGHAVLVTSSPESILDSFEELIDHGMNQSALSDPICRCLAQLILLKAAETAQPHDEAGSPAFSTYQRCIELIKANYLRLHTLPDIAATCHIDAAYLCRLFKRFGHQSPYQYLLRLRMNRAAEQLLEPGILVKTVATNLGFDDPFHFSRTFKRTLGVSPRRFAQMHGVHNAFGAS